MTLTLEQSNYLVVPLVYLMMVFWLSRRFMWGSMNSHLFRTPWAQAWALVLAQAGIVLFFGIVGGGIDSQIRNPALVALAEVWGFDPASLLISAFILAAAAGLVDGMVLGGAGTEAEPKQRYQPRFEEQRAP